MSTGEKSKVIQYPDLGVYQPNGEKAMKGSESAGFEHQELGDITPQTVDPQTKKSGLPGN